MNNNNNNQQQFKNNDLRMNFLNDHIQRLPVSILNLNNSSGGGNNNTTPNIVVNSSSNSLVNFDYDYRGGNANPTKSNTINTSPNSNKRFLNDEEFEKNKKMKILLDEGEILSSSSSSTQISPRLSSSSTTTPILGPQINNLHININSPIYNSNSTNNNSNTNNNINSSNSGNSTPRKRKNEIICSICEKPNNLLMCDAQCLRSFHVECLGLSGMAPNHNTDQHWECDDCVNDRNICFSCKQRGIVGMDLMKCKVHQCGKFYHYKCVSEFKLAKLINTKTPRFNCPLHYCNGCGVSGDGKQSVHCVRCPTAYHVICMPPGVKMLTKSKETRKTGLVICPKHANDHLKAQSIPHPSSHLIYSNTTTTTNNGPQFQVSQPQQQSPQHQHNHNHHHHLNNSTNSNIVTKGSNEQSNNNPLYNLIYSTSPIATPNILSPTSSPSFSPIDSPRYIDNNNNNNSNNTNKSKTLYKNTAQSPNKNNNNNSNYRKNSMDKLIEMAKISNNSFNQNQNNNNFSKPFSLSSNNIRDFDSNLKNHNINATGDNEENFKDCISSLVSIKEHKSINHGNNISPNDHYASINNPFSTPNTIPGNHKQYNPPSSKMNDILFKCNENKPCDENRLIEHFFEFASKSKVLPPFSNHINKSC